MCEIYVRCLSARDASFDHGVWINATMDLMDIHQLIDEMLSISPVSNNGEFEISDADTYGYDLICTDTSIEEAHEIAVFLEDHGELGAALLDSGEASCLESAASIIDNSYLGIFKSGIDFAMHHVKKHYEYIDDFVNTYIDYDAMWRDLEGDYFFVEMHGSMYFFRR